MSRLREEHPMQAAIELDPRIEQELGGLIPKESYIGVQLILNLMREKYPREANPAEYKKLLLCRWDFEDDDAWGNDNRYSPINRSAHDVDYRTDDLTRIGRHNPNLAYLLMQDPNLCKFLPRYEQQELSRWERSTFLYNKRPSEITTYCSYVITGLVFFLGLFVLSGLVAGPGMVGLGLGIMFAAPIIAIPIAILLGTAIKVSRELYLNEPVTVKDHANAYAKKQGLPPVSKIGMYKSPKPVTDGPPSYEASRDHHGKISRKNSVEPPPYKHSSSFIGR